MELLIVDGGGGLKAAHGHTGRGSVRCRYMEATGTVAQSQLERGKNKQQERRKEPDPIKKTLGHVPVCWEL